MPKRLIRLERCPRGRDGHGSAR
ncbi:MAG: hypothetical protein QOJ99_955, partial [Bryobacterales bacterium]|nr:hypothetical protein [Bryobacterales bacterium]